MENIMKKATLATLGSFVLFSPLAIAHDEPSYSYFEAGYLDYDIDANLGETEPDGYRLKLSVELGDSFFAVVDRNEANGSNFDVETEGYGFGFHGDFWYASYTYNDWEFGNIETEVDTLRAGFRTELSDRFEFNASYSWNDIDDFENEDGFQVGVVFKLTDLFSLTAEYETIDGELGVDYLSAGVRLSF